MGAVKNIAKNILIKGKTYIYHYEQNKEAYRMLKLVESEKQKLDPNIKKLCKEYAKDVFSNEIYAPWLFVYSAFANEFKEGWIPDNFYGEYVVPSLKGDYGKICDRNAVISKLLQEPDSLDICYYVNHLFLNPNYEILNQEKLKHTLFSKNEKVVYKIENSLQGKGVYFFDEKSFDLNYIKKLGNGVFQKYIEQHPFFYEFHESSVATIRLTSTCDNDGNIDVKAGYFRFGRGNDTHVISDRQMRIPIDIRTGKLCDTAYFPKSESTKHLPDNEILFAGKTLPAFDNCLAEVKKLHRRVPFIRCIGWDIIVDKNDKVKLIELNGGHNGITFNEMVQGPCFRGLNWENFKK
ncbi:sugar-transfer associated ATP-grasp domain-containing protein [Winogradskyella thalassocola]|uniref:Sugar-transfer associated ATP-grasp n=1 Tax=Winogradskyella thalassocola TaxID=262004 RepID=A0A1G8DJM4_9FLAO|nr:sugar-transfer associated ATP-grasp domain-containing protein [Winogradskyella thalassocola]SDH57842.1 Sugar-transfer associated ATP-grasp [Winogradskyella thalassocola]